MIKDLKAREILDSRGNPTVEVTLVTEKGSFISSVPSGASTGVNEAKELRDGGERFGGKGVLNVIENIEEKIKPLLEGKEVDNPVELDGIICRADGTEDKSNFGANAILGVSMSLFRAAAVESGKPLFYYLREIFDFSAEMPAPCFNVINGGVHSGGGTSFQEFMIVPQKESYKENLRSGAEYYRKLKEILKEKYGERGINIGDEGGFVPPAKSAKEVLDILSEGGFPVIIDAAATEFFKEGSYFLDKEIKTTQEMISYYKEIVKEYPLLGIEDPLQEDDFSGWSELSKELGESLIVGDDLLVTNIGRIEKAEKEEACNAMILKINQIGSVSEALEAAKKAKEIGFKIIVSHRSGETNDDFISDLAVGIGAEYIKAGAPARGERVAKYNRLLKIESDL